MPCKFSQVCALHVRVRYYFSVHQSVRARRTIFAHAMPASQGRVEAAVPPSRQEQEGAAEAAPVPDVQMSDAAGPAAAQDVEMMAGAVRVEQAGGGGGGGALLVEDVD